MRPPRAYPWPAAAVLPLAFSPQRRADRGLTLSAGIRTLIRESVRWWIYWTLWRLGSAVAALDLLEFALRVLAATISFSLIVLVTWGLGAIPHAGVFAYRVRLCVHHPSVHGILLPRLRSA